MGYMHYTSYRQGFGWASFRMLILHRPECRACEFAYVRYQTLI
jgi:hypothetical protein